MTLATMAVVGAVASLVVGSWWLLAAAVAVHALATLVIVATILRLSGETDKPDPVTVADLEAEGVIDPEARYNKSVHGLEHERDEHGGN